MQDFLGDLTWRGLLGQCTDATLLAAYLQEQPRSIYIGFDPTADSLHVGHLLQVMMLRRFQRAGHRPIALVGGATGMIGDPSGKSAERNLLSRESLRSNVISVREQLARFLDFGSGPASALLVDNSEWMGRFSFLEFLRDVGKHASVNTMLAKDSVKSRLERADGGLSYTEFSYMLLQAYDFVHLHDAYGCGVQAGGSDQWGNITAGIDLARRMRSVQLHGLTCPLLVKSDGTKMGKTEAGALWLDPRKTSPYTFYQYWVNLADADAGRCLRTLTDLDRETIEALEAEHAAAPDQRKAQKRLAAELTRLVHGDQALASALGASRVLFGGELSQLGDAELLEIFADVPSRVLPRALLTGEGLAVVDALVESGLAKSKGEARRSLEQGGVYLNNARVEDPSLRLGPGALAGETMVVLRTGKRNYALLQFPRQTGVGSPVPLGGGLG